MFVRNLVILAFFAPAAVLSAAGPLVVMAVAALFFIWREKEHGQDRIAELKLSSPLSLLKVLKFGLIFLIIQIVGSLGQRYLGHLGFLLVSFLGGLISSASTAGAAATLAMRGNISAETAGMATVLTSLASALSNLPLVHHQVRSWTLTRKLGYLSFGIVVLGLLVMLIVRFSPAGRL